MNSKAQSISPFCHFSETLTVTGEGLRVCSNAVYFFMTRELPRQVRAGFTVLVFLSASLGLVIVSLFSKAPIETSFLSHAGVSETHSVSC